MDSPLHRRACAFQVHPMLRCINLLPPLLPVVRLRRPLRRLG
jgi:hypothetical protein